MIRSSMYTAGHSRKRERARIADVESTQKIQGFIKNGDITGLRLEDLE